MPPSDPTDAWVTVTRPETADFLVDVERIAFLEPFLRDTLTVSELAEALEVSLQKAHYRVRTMVQLELLEVAYEESRGGRAIKHYRLTAPGFYVPFEMIRHHPIEDFADKASLPFRRTLVRNLFRSTLEAIGDLSSWGMSIGPSKSGRSVAVSVTAGPNGDSFAAMMRANPMMPAATSGWYNLWLDHHQARSFDREVQALIQRYRRENGNQQYLLHYAIAPIRD